MKYVDEIYGEVEIDEPVILEIINSPFFQRLKGVGQSGYNFEKLVIHNKIYQCTRFDHSLGCYILVKKFGAKLEEQIAALIHDISHTVFSHCIDYALSDVPEKNEYQDNEFKKYILKTNIPDILKKYNYDLDYILNEKNFGLQERDLPDLCGDRIDYALRQFFDFMKLDNEKIKYYLDNLIISNNLFVFKDGESALSFSDSFEILNRVYYSNKETAVLFFTNSNYIKYALDKGYIEYDELFTTEKFVIEKINKNIENDKKLEYFWEEINAPFSDFSFNENNFDRKIVCKSRAVDPLFFENGTLKRVTEKYPEYFEKYNREKRLKTYFIKYLK